MSKYYIPFLTFLLLLLLFAIPFSFDFATSVVPGWHITIVSYYSIWKFIVYVILLSVTVGYWLLARRAYKINWAVFIAHFILTIPTVVFLKFPSDFLNLQSPEWAVP